MEKSKMILIVLVALTLMASFASTNVGMLAVFGILLLATFKFIGVSFYFMELRKAHPFWKGVLLAFLIIFIGSVILIV